MSGVLNLRQFVTVGGLWLAVALAACIASLCLSGASGRVGVDATAPWRVVELEFRGRQWAGTALTADDDVMAFNALQEHQKRVLAAGLVGMALAAAGVTLQALLRNALADPFILGISSGSTVGVAAWKLLPLFWPAVFGGFSAVLVIGRSLPAVVGAVLSCILVFALAHRRGAGLQPVTLLLVGVVVSSINGALLMILSMLDTPDTRSGLAVYMLGNISENDLTRSIMWTALVAFLIGYVPVLLSAAALNIGTFSDTQAQSLGVNVQRLRTLCFICASIMTASAILLSGPIGFVGLICPHICRRLPGMAGGGGADHRTLLITAPLCGAAFLMLADTLANIALTFNHGPLPVGVVTALCGGPFFLYLLRRRAT